MNPSLRRAVLALGLAAVATVPFLPGVSGAFVFDDLPQIVRNETLTEPGLVRRAFTTDVWSFKGERDQAFSPYWRPLFVLWLGGLARLLGRSATWGWHVASLALHALAVLLAYRLGRALGLDRVPATIAAALAAVHPTRVESVVWISGSPDLLAAVAVLAALVVVASALRSGSWARALTALALYAAALLAKEAALLAPLAAIALCWTVPGIERRARYRASLRAAVGSTVVAGVYLFLRARALGSPATDPPWSRSVWVDLLSAPRVLLFHLRQLVWPAPLSPTYPLDAVTPATADWTSFVLPALVVLVLAAVAVWLVRGRPVARFGAIFFLAFLAPVLHVTAFAPDQIVRDRYLYLPLFGAALAVVDLASGLGDHVRSEERRRARAGLVAALLVAAALGWVSARYAAVWTSDLRLYERAVAVAPRSSFFLALLADAQLAAGDLPAARASAERAAALTDTVGTRRTRGTVALAERRWSEAEVDFRRIREAAPDDPLAYDSLAVALRAQGRLAEAEAILRNGMEEIPWRRCSFGSNLAVVLAGSGRFPEALAELEAVRPLVPAEPTVPCRASLVYLGDLYRASGRQAEARAAYAEFLNVTSAAGDRRFANFRAQAERGLAALRR